MRRGGCGFRSERRGTTGCDGLRRRTRVALNIRDFGAKGDGATKDTAAIQQAIDRCSVFGGGEVLAPAGNYLTGAIALRSDTILRLDKDAAIVGSPILTITP